MDVRIVTLDNVTSSFLGSAQTKKRTKRQSKNNKREPMEADAVTAVGPVRPIYEAKVR